MDAWWRVAGVHQEESERESRQPGERVRSYPPILANPLPSQLLSVANGLEYLHSHEITHGNLKGVRAVPNTL